MYSFKKCKYAKQNSVTIKQNSKALRMVYFHQRLFIAEIKFGFLSLHYSVWLCDLIIDLVYWMGFSNCLKCAHVSVRKSYYGLLDVYTVIRLQLVLLPCIETVCWVSRKIPICKNLALVIFEDFLWQAHSQVSFWEKTRRRRHRRGGYGEGCPLPRKLWFYPVLHFGAFSIHVYCGTAVKSVTCTLYWGCMKFLPTLMRTFTVLMSPSSIVPVIGRSCRKWLTSGGHGKLECVCAGLEVHSRRSLNAFERWTTEGWKNSIKCAKTVWLLISDGTLAKMAAHAFCWVIFITVELWLWLWPWYFVAVSYSENLSTPFSRSLDVVTLVWMMSISLIVTVIVFWWYSFQWRGCGACVLQCYSAWKVMIVADRSRLWPTAWDVPVSDNVLEMHNCMLMCDSLLLL